MEIKNASTGDAAEKMQSEFAGSVIFAIILVPLSVFVIVLAPIIFEQLLNPHTMMYGRDLEYYEEIKAVHKETDTLYLADIFTFEWDQVVFVDKARFPGDNFGRFDIEGYCGNLDPRDPLRRAFFVSDGYVVNYFTYDLNYIKFDPIDIAVAREDAQFTISKSGKLLTLTLNE